MLGRDRATQFHGLFGKLDHQSLGPSPLGIVGRQDVGVQVGIADVPEDHVLARKLAVQGVPVDTQHFLVAGDGDCEIGAHLGKPLAPHKVVDGLGHGMAESAETLAVGGRHREPGSVEERP